MIMFNAFVMIYVTILCYHNKPLTTDVYTLYAGVVLYRTTLVVMEYGRSSLESSSRPQVA